MTTAATVAATTRKGRRRFLCGRCSMRYLRWVLTPVEAVTHKEVPCDRCT